MSTYAKAVKEGRATDDCLVEDAEALEPLHLPPFFVNAHDQLAAKDLIKELEDLAETNHFSGETKNPDTDQHDQRSRIGAILER